MIKTQLRSDQAAMTLSMVCIVHCFFAPSVLIIGSGFLAVNLGDELVHKLIGFNCSSYKFSCVIPWL